MTALTAVRGVRRWLGRVRYREAHALQHGLFEHGTDDWLLLLEHPHVYTLGVRADPAHVLVDPAVGRRRAGARRPGRRRHLPRARPARRLPDPHRARQAGRGDGRHGGLRRMRVEQLLIDVLADLGLPDAGRLDGYPGVWVEPDGPTPAQDRGHRRAPDPRAHRCTASPSTCRPTSRGSTTSCRAASPTRPSRRWRPRASTSSMREVVDAVAARAADAVGRHGVERQDVAWRERPTTWRRSAGPRRRRAGAADGRLRRPASPVAADHAPASPTGCGRRCDDGPRLPALKAHDARPRPRHGVRGGRLPEHLRVLGRRHRHVHDQRRALHPGVRLLPGRHPPAAGARSGRARAASPRRSRAWGCGSPCSPPSPATTSPTAARPASRPRSRAIRAPPPEVGVEVLIPDCKGDPDALDVIFAARPDVLNHNLETVARLQRAVRPSAATPAAWPCWPGPRRPGSTTKSGLIVGLGETDDEVVGALADLPGSASTSSRSASTCGRRPTTCRWPAGGPPTSSTELKAVGEALGIAPRRGVAR